MMMTLHYQLYNITKMCFRINTNYNTNIFIYIYIHRDMRMHYVHDV